MNTIEDKNYVIYKNYIFNIKNLTINVSGDEFDINLMPYKEHKIIEVIYTANYIQSCYADNYGIKYDSECVKIAEKARQIMYDYDVTEDFAIDYALRELGYIVDNEEEILND